MGMSIVLFIFWFFALLTYGLRDNYQYIKNKDLLVNTDYTISKRGDVKSVYIEVIENKNKDDFKVEY